jgi:undecaprenyl-diphosphatase
MLSESALVPLRSRIFIVLVVSFVAITAMVVSKISDALDVYALQALVSSRTYALDIFMLIVTSTADILPFYLSPMLIISFILLVRKRSRRLGAILIISVLVTTFLVLQIKNIVYKDRPEYEFKVEGLDYRIELDAFSSSSAYPSGHAARSAAFALILSYMLRSRSVNLGLLLWIYPILISISRVYVGEHYPTDVIGGSILGLIVANTIGRIFKLDSTLDRGDKHGNKDRM